MKDIIEQFDSAEALTRHLLARKAKWQWLDKVERYTKFSQCQSVKKALEMLANGWPEQAQKMKPVEDDIFANLTQGIERFDPAYVECDGHTLDIAAYCAGEPEHWIRFEPSIVEGQSNRILRIGINIIASGSTAQETITQRGTVACALIEALEQRGYRCETWVLCRIKSMDSKLTHQWELLAKPAEQPLSLAHLLFESAHPAMLRRLGFALLTSRPEAGQFQAAKGQHTFGYPCDPEDTSQYDIYVPALSYRNSDQSEQPTNTQRWLKAQIQKIEGHDGNQI